MLDSEEDIGGGDERGGGKTRKVGGTTCGRFA